MSEIKRPDHDPKVQKYYPDVIAPAKEFKQLAAAENPELRILWDGAWQWLENTFVYDFNEEGCERWESMLSITPDPGETLEERRAAILAKIRDGRPYTERTINGYLAGFPDGDTADTKVYPGDYAVECISPGDAGADARILVNALRVYIPANLSIIFTLHDDGIFSAYAVSTEKDNEELSEEIRYINDGGANIYAGIAYQQTGYIRVRPALYEPEEATSGFNFCICGIMDKEVLNGTDS